MSLARVWNDHDTQPYKEEFKGEMIHIAPNKYVEMEKFDALQFVSAYVPIRKDAMGNYLNHKKLRVEVIPDPEPAKVEHRCMACRGTFDTANELAMHSEAFHKELIVADSPKTKK